MFFPSIIIIFICFLKNRTLHNHLDYAGFSVPYYNIPSNNRELQLSTELTPNHWIITYQVITGNYSPLVAYALRSIIITYQVITGNYSVACLTKLFIRIITYQVITGNYSIWLYSDTDSCIITYQVITGNYSCIYCGM